MVHLGDRLLIPTIKNNPKSWLCPIWTENYCCGYWNFIFTAELNVVEFFLSQFSLILLYVQWNSDLLVKNQKKIWLIKWENLLNGVDWKFLFLYFWELATYVCWIFVIFCSLNTFSPVFVCPSMSSVIVLRGMHCSSVILVWQMLKTPSTFFYYLQIFGYWKCFALYAHPWCGPVQGDMCKINKKFNEKVNLTLNSLYWYIHFTVSTEMK